MVECSECHKKLHESQVIWVDLCLMGDDNEVLGTIAVCDACFDRVEAEDDD
jgi:hypothetical protein